MKRLSKARANASPSKNNGSRFENKLKRPPEISSKSIMNIFQSFICEHLNFFAVVARAFQPAGSRNFPVPCFANGDWKVARTRRQECLRYTLGIALAALALLPSRLSAEDWVRYKARPGAKVSIAG